MQKEKRNHTASGFQNSFRDVVLAGKRPQFAPKISRPGPRLNLYWMAYKLLLASMSGRTA
jgi:hypothetical protein